MLSCGDRVPARRVHDNDASARCGIHVHIVNANPCTSNGLESFRSVDYVCRDLRLGPHNQCAVIGCNCDEFLFFETRLDVDEQLPALL